MAITQAENEKLTQVGPGTPMGDLLRRYWHPVGALAELDDEHPIKPIRLLGEDLVIYRDGNGTYGCIERWCAHRGTDLSMGWCEETGIRCPRHGWLYMENGQCIDMPLEDEPFADQVKLKGYHVAVRGGMLWAYLGPEPEPLVPDWAPFSFEDGLTQIVFAGLPCNWLQCQESSLDPIATEWLQAMASSTDDRPPPPAMDMQFEFDEFEHGYVYRRKDGETWNVGRTSIWPNGMFVGDERSCRFEWHVPIDDTHTVAVMWFFDKARPGTELPEPRVVHWYAKIREDDKEDWRIDHVLNRSFAIWLEQGTVLDRTREHLVEGDKGLVILRDKLFTQMDVIVDGGEPKAVLRDESANRALRLPDSKTRAPEKPKRRRRDFPYVAGQPEDAAQAYRQVIESWLPPSKRRGTRKPKAP